MGTSTQFADGVYIGTMLTWMEFGFAQFAFDLIEMIHGTYEAGRLSSFYGIGGTSLAEPSSAD